MMKRWGLIMVLGVSLAAVAQVDMYPFDTAAERQKFRQLLQQYRCLVCQNQTLAGSDAPLAKDLRDKIYQQVKVGATEAQISQYLTARYGDTVLFKPPLRPRTWLLWLAPLGLLLAGAWFVVRKTLPSS